MKPDVVEIQAQGAERDTAKFDSFVRAAAAQARSANAHVLVLAGVSTGPTGHVVTPAELAAAVAATRDVVDGYWLNVPAHSPYCPRCTVARPELAVQLLHQLAGEHTP